MRLITVSVGIPAYNEEKNIRTLLASLLAQKRSGYRLERIYVVDDKSTDSTVREIQSAGSTHVTLIRNRRRMGQALSQNKILKANTSDILVLMNADILPATDSLLVQIVKTSRRAPPRWGIIGTHTIPHPGSSFFEKIMGYAYSFRMKTARTYNNGDNIYTAIGAARGVSREFAQVFRFPKLQTEDVYMYMWAKKHGYSYIHSHRAVCRIKMPATMRDHLKQSSRYISSTREMLRYFAADSVKETYDIPPLHLFESFFTELLRHPLYMSTYLLIVLYSRLFPYISRPDALWEEVPTSKSFGSHTVLIPDATGPANIGDQAILAALLELIRDNYPRTNIKIHSNFPERYDAGSQDFLDHTLYSYSVYDDPRTMTRIIRMLDLIGHYVARKAGFDYPWGHRKIVSLLKDYDEASLIVFPGGGYLRSRTGVTQILNVLMHSLMIDIAVMTGKPTLVAPISFGPFGYTWLARYTARVLSRCRYVTVREKVSYDTLASYGLTNLVLCTDHALLLPYKRKLKKNIRTVGFTIRHWLDGDSEETFENAFAQSLIHLARKHKLSIQPIIQVYAPGYGREHDAEITARIATKLSAARVRVLPTLQPPSLEHAVTAYGSVGLILGMRMHSSIISATQRVPYVAIAYEHKTQGISDALGYGDMCLRVQDVRHDNLTRLLEYAQKERVHLSRRLGSAVEELALQERKRWSDIFTSLAASPLTGGSPYA